MKRRWSRRCGSSWNFAASQKTGWRSFPSRRKIAASRFAISSLTSYGFIRLPEPEGAFNGEAVPVKRVMCTRLPTIIMHIGSRIGPRQVELPLTLPELDSVGWYSTRCSCQPAKAPGPGGKKRKGAGSAQMRWNSRTTPATSIRSCPRILNGKIGSVPRVIRGHLLL